MTLGEYTLAAYLDRETFQKQVEGFQISRTGIIVN